MKLRLAAQWGMSVEEVGRKLPAHELPLWHAWQYIEPMGFQAMDYQFARLARRLMGMWCKGDPPDLQDLMTPERDWREFDPELAEELELEREIRKMEHILRPDIP